VTNIVADGIFIKIKLKNSYFCKKHF